MMRFLVFLFFFSTQTILAQTYVVNYLPRDFVKDGSIDYTEYIQLALDKGGDIYMPDFKVLINSKGLELRSETSLFFGENSKVYLQPNANSHYAMLSLEDVNNVYIKNAVLVGDSELHFGTSGEWGMGIYIKGGENIIIENGQINNCWGDGISIVNSKTRNSEKIKVSQMKFDKNRRNAITIGSGVNIELSDLSISNTGGTLPEAAICIEPNDNISLIQNLVIDHILSKRNGVGLSMGFMRYPGKYVKPIEISINYFSSSNDSIGVLYGDYKRDYGSDIKPLIGKITISNLKIDNPVKEGIKLYSQFGYKFSPPVYFKDVSIQLRDKNLLLSQRMNLKDYKRPNVFFQNIIVK